MRPTRAVQLEHGDTEVDETRPEALDEMEQDAAAAMDEAAEQPPDPPRAPAVLSGPRAPYRAELTDDALLELVPYVVLDTETTGAERATDRVIELALYRYFRGELVAALTVLLDPGHPEPARASICAGATGAHGFTDEKLAALRPVRFEAAEPLVTELLGGAVLCGHNVDFDLDMLRREYAVLSGRAGDETFDRCVWSGYRVCSLALARLLFPEERKHKLENLAGLLDLPPFAAHRAAGDAKVAYAVLHPLLARWRAQNPGREPTLRYLTDLAVWPFGVPGWLKKKQAEEDRARGLRGTRR